MNGQIIYTRQSIAPIVFKPEVMGIQTDIAIARIKGSICTPQLGTISSDKFSPVLPPRGYDIGVLHWNEDNKKIRWGKQLLIPTGETAVTEYLLQFRLARTKRKAMKQMEEIELELEAWFLRLRDWIEVLTHQDLSVDEPLSGTRDTGNYFWSWQSKKRWIMATSATFYASLSTPDTKKALTQQQWDYAIKHANKGTAPPDEHLLLRDALARFRRGQNNYAVIFAGVAVELTLKKKLETVLARRGKTKKLIDDLLNNSLGKIFDICEAIGVKLPKDARTINAMRNSAIHNNKRVTKEDAANALTTTSELIKLHSALGGA